MPSDIPLTYWSEVDQWDGGNRYYFVGNNGTLIHMDFSEHGEKY